MQPQVSRPVRYSLLSVVAVLAASLLWLGFVRWQAERRATSLAIPAAQVEAAPLQHAAEAPPAAAGANRTGKEPVALEQPAKELLVHVAGAVAQPGVYKLQPGMRVSDALAAAGGVTSGAMPDALNLAARVNDGEKIYVPTAEEAKAAAAAVPASRGGTQRPTASSPPPPAGPVNVNTAGVTELDRVSGIGPVMAQAIVEYRKQHGPFRRLEDLTAVRGIGPATLERLRKYLTV
jgi:competence protein ComEA